MVPNIGAACLINSPVPPQMLTGDSTIRHKVGRGIISMSMVRDLRCLLKPFMCGLDANNGYEDSNSDCSRDRSRYRRSLL